MMQNLRRRRAATLCIALPWVGLVWTFACHQAEGGPAGVLGLPDGFRAELVYEVPGEKQGSWVAMTVDAKGRLIASDQKGALYRLTPSKIGGSARQTRVEKIALNIGMAQGLACVGNNLYLTLNGQYGSFSSGIYRLRDANRDDRYDAIDQLRVLQGIGEHGPHAIVPAPDGKSLYLCCGNMTQLPHADSSQPPRRWGEDQLLPRLFSPLADTSGMEMPGGWVARIDLEGETLEIVSAGLRNPYDMAFNDDGELFTFDADTESDVGSSWYRPTRLCHIVEGSDYGWRSGNGKWPEHYVDTLPPVVNVGQGSPTGMAWGKDTKFPPKYQRSLFLGDWSYGRILVAEPSPLGASYTATIEPFAAASPLGVTDLVVRPQDGALYLTVGGRQSQSAVYRIYWKGNVAGSRPSQEGPGKNEAITESNQTTLTRQSRELRQLRRRLESSDSSDLSIEETWSFLGHEDRFVRHAARVALEREPVDSWLGRAFAEPSPVARTLALTAAARVASPTVQKRWVMALTDLAWTQLPRHGQLDWLRTASLGALRFDPLEDEFRQQLLNAVESHFPTSDTSIDHELVCLLVKLGAPNMPTRLLEALLAAKNEEHAFDIAVALSAVREGWSTAQRNHFLDWCDDVARRGGPFVSSGHLDATRKRFFEAVDGPDRTALADRLAKPLPNQVEGATSNRPFVREWKLGEVVALVETSTHRPSFEEGKRLFAGASCYQCHRVGSFGSAVGPNLTTVARRFSLADLLKAIVDPNAEISDLYQQSVFVVGGRTLTGRVANMSGDSLIISTNMLDFKSEVAVRRADIELQYPAKTSLMPEGLLNSLNDHEIVDLVAFLRSGGDPAAPIYADGDVSRP